MAMKQQLDVSNWHITMIIAWMLISIAFTSCVSNGDYVKERRDAHQELIKEFRSDSSRYPVYKVSLYTLDSVPAWQIITPRVYRQGDTVDLGGGKKYIVNKVLRINDIPSRLNE